MTRIGTTGGDSLRGPGFTVSIAALKAEHERFFKAWMEA
jgi:phosphoribosylformylglycinamidine synthase